MASLKRYKFCLSTSSLCFLCSEEISHDDVKDFNVTSYSLRNLLQYLNIELCKIKTLSTKPVSILNKTDIRVNLCASCRDIIVEISKLYRTMEVIRMKLDYNFKLFQKRMQSSSESKFQISEKAFIRHSHLVKELRQEIRRKCDLRIRNYQPRVTLEKVNDSIVRKTLNLMHQKDLRISQKQDILYPVINYQSSEAHQNQFPVSSNGETIYAFRAPESPGPETEDDNIIDNIGDASDNVETSSYTDFNLEQKVGSFASHTELAVVCPSSRRTCWVTEKGENEGFSKSLAKLKSWDRLYTKDPATGLFECSKCNKNFTHYSNFYSHYDAIHLLKRFKCKTCKRVFKYKYDLQKHKKICLKTFNQRLAKERNPNFKFVCEICEKRCETMKKLKGHLRAVHLTVKRYPCDVCDKRFTTPSHLKSHKAGAHLGERLLCRFCKKGFAYICNLRKHEKACLQRDNIKTENLSNN